MSMKRTDRKSPGFSVRFANLDCEVTARAGESVLDCAQRGGVGLSCACGGVGRCGSCLIRVLAGAASHNPGGSAPPAPGADSAWVRACLVRPLGDLVVEVSARGLAPPLRACSEPPPAGASLLGPSVQAGEGEAGAAASGSRSLGLAVDLGTTNIAGSLTDLATGEELAVHLIANPQRVYGADLISRIGHAVRRPEGRRELQSSAVGALREMVSGLCRKAAAHPGEIAGGAVCGNTAMHHLLLGLPVAQLGRAPFTPASTVPLDIEAHELGLELAPGARLHALPCIGGFVGGDHVAALLATEPLWRTGTSLLVDIGTNTELSLVRGGSITTASTASGPALEAGNISCGMPAAEGAIERIWLSGTEIRTRVIGGGAAVGLCGSGVLDALDALRQAGIIDRRGYLSPGAPGVSGSGGNQEFRFAPGVGFTQNDVRAVLLAKAAIRAGIDLLLAEAGLGERELDRVLIAGSFGACIDVGGAVGVGMFPALPPERFRQVGNAAAAGVRLALVSAAARSRAAELARACRHLELNGRPGFRKAFIGRLGL